MWGRGALGWIHPPVLSLAPQLRRHPACPRLLLGAGDSGRLGRYHCLPACLAPCSPPAPALSFPRSLTEPPSTPTPTPTRYFRGGRMPLTSRPPTRETRSGILACGGAGGFGIGDTGPGTPGPRSAPGWGPGVGQPSRCWEGRPREHGNSQHHGGLTLQDQVLGSAPF